ncbi:MAG: hypothetical protein OXI90_08620 [Gammaproteobacteria bacterium]|nr:hypothetical protein [Gammaproteobacteria bacterium]
MGREPTDGTVVWSGRTGRRERRSVVLVEPSSSKRRHAVHVPRVVDAGVPLRGEVPHQRPEGASVSDRYPEGRDRACAGSVRRSRIERGPDREDAQQGLPIGPPGVFNENPDPGQDTEDGRGALPAAGGVG